MADTRRVNSTAEPDASENTEELRKKIQDYERWFATMDQQILSLERERQRLTSLVKYSDAGVMLFDTESRVTWANETYEDKFTTPGPQRRDPVGMSCHQTLCRRKEPCKDCPVARLLSSSKVAHHELNMFIGDRYRPVYSTATPVFSPDGKVEQALVMLQDLSNLVVLRQSEEALRSNEQRFRSVFEQAGAGMITTKADGSFLQVTTNMCTLLG
jgi:PAS domain-containing protein